MSDRKWTVDDVQRLVSRIQEASIMSMVLADELRPFLPDPPDPDAELIRTIDLIRHEGDDATPDDNNRRIIAAVREHDAKAVAK